MSPFAKKTETPHSKETMKIPALTALFVSIAMAISSFVIVPMAQAVYITLPVFVYDGCNYYTGLSYDEFYIYNGGGYQGVGFCMHSGRCFNDATYSAARYTNSGEQALLTLGWPANENWFYYNGGWHYFGDTVKARSTTQLAVWGVRGYYTPDDGTVTFYSWDVHDAMSYLYYTYFRYQYSSFEPIRFDSAISRASSSWSSPTLMDADAEFETANLNYDYLEYRGFKVSSDLPSRWFSSTLTVKDKNGNVISPGSQTYQYDGNTGTISIYKNFLKGKTPGDIIICLDASNRVSQTGIVYSRFSSSYQDIMWAPGYTTRYASRYVAPNWIEIQYKIENDEFGGIVEDNNLLGNGVRTLRQNDARDDLAKYHIVTTPRTYSILDEAPDALNVRDCMTISKLGSGANGIYYFFTDNWYLDAACTTKFGPDDESLNQRARNKAYISKSTVLHARWLQAEVSIEANPSWDDDPLNVGETVRYTISYTNNNDKPEKVTLFDSPPANSKFIVGTETMTKYNGQNSYSGKGRNSIGQGATALAPQNRLSEHYTDEDAESKKIRDLVPNIPVYSIEKDQFEDAD